MALTFPLSLAAFADRLQWADFDFQLMRFEEFLGSSRHQNIKNEVGDPAWSAFVELRVLKYSLKTDIRATIEALGRPSSSFYLHNLRACGPMNDPAGIILGSSVPLINTIGGNRSLSLSGLPAGYVLKRGDFLSFDFATDPVRRGFHRLVEDATANGSGVTPSFEVEPYLKTGTSVALEVTLIKPSAKMALATFDPGTRGGPMGFTALEIL
jgi:hypothetical protein